MTGGSNLMNTSLLLQGSIEIVLSFFTGLFIFFVSFKVFSFITKDIDELKELKDNNMSVAILGVSFIFGIMIIVKEAIGPSMDTLTQMLSVKNLPLSSMIFSIVRILVFYIVSALFAFIILWLSIKLFLLLTSDIDEMEEMRNKNIAVSIVIASLIISMSLILRKPLTLILSGLVATPAIKESGINEHLINMTLFLEGLIELGLSIFGVLFVFFVSFKIFQLLTKNIDEIAEIKKNNIAIGIMNGSFVFSIMLVINTALDPANQDLKRALSVDDMDFIVVLFSALRIIFFFLGAALLAFIIIWISMKCFMVLTRGIDEMNEIKNNNIAVSLLIAILVISSAFLLQHGVKIILEGLIPLPKLDSGVLDITNIK
jgi:uncharacterized membrane protein YjfL (UPF0719 family)